MAPPLSHPPRSLAPTAPSRRSLLGETAAPHGRRPGGGRRAPGPVHPLTDQRQNALLHDYDSRVKGCFDRIVPVLQRLSALQPSPDFVGEAQRLVRQELGFPLPEVILEQAWVSGVDMRRLFGWCVFRAYEQISHGFFQDDPLCGAPGSPRSREFEEFLLGCGFHLLDITPCADGRLAHTIAYALRIPFSSVRRRSHAGALFDVANTVNRWVKTEHRRYREGQPNPATEPTRYLKVVVYHFSSRDPSHQGCAAHGSDDAAAAAAGLQRLRDFREAVENSFCCGASVDLLLIGLDTDTDAIRVHVPARDGAIDASRWLDARELHEATLPLSPESARQRLDAAVREAADTPPDDGMIRFIAGLLERNISQIDYVRRHHDGAYPDAGHAERFIGVGIGFKEIHLRNLTYFAHLDTVEEGAPDLDVGVKIFRGLNVRRGLPIPVVIRFDYSGSVPGACERAAASCRRVAAAIETRYADLFQEGLLHTLLTIRDRDRPSPAMTIASSILPDNEEAH